jgi:hypothetical protein
MARHCARGYILRAPTWSGFSDGGRALKLLYFLTTALFFAWGAADVSAQSVNVTFDRKADFYQFKTYKWVTIKDARLLDDLTTEQLIATVDVELAKKGLTKSKTDKADLFVAYQIARPGQKQLSHFNVGASYGSAAGANSAAAGASATTVHTGLLVLDMYESTNQQLVWRGVESKTIDADAKPAKKQKHLDKAIEKLLKDYPPQKTQ